MNVKTYSNMLFGWNNWRRFNLPSKINIETIIRSIQYIEYEYSTFIREYNYYYRIHDYETDRGRGTLLCLIDVDVKTNECMNIFSNMSSLSHNLCTLMNYEEIDLPSDKMHLSILVDERKSENEQVYVYDGIL